MLATSRASSEEQGGACGVQPSGYHRPRLAIHALFPALAVSAPQGLKLEMWISEWVF